MERPQEGGAKDCINVPDHMNKILVATRLSKAVEKGIPWMYIAQTILWSLTLKTMQFCLISQRYLVSRIFFLILIHVLISNILTDNLTFSFIHFSEGRVGYDDFHTLHYGKCTGTELLQEASTTKAPAVPPSNGS